MSDSYSAYCERLERDARLFSGRNIASVKRTKRFKELLEKAKAAHKSAKLCEAKMCHNCMHRDWLNGKAICAKLGIRLESDDLVCNKWRGAPYTVAQPEFNEDVLAWAILEKNKFEYGC